MPLKEIANKLGDTFGPALDAIVEEQSKVSFLHSSPGAQESPQSLTRCTSRIKRKHWRHYPCVLRFFNDWSVHLLPPKEKKFLFLICRVFCRFRAGLETTTSFAAYSSLMKRNAQNHDSLGMILMIPPGFLPVGLAMGWWRTWRITSGIRPRSE